MNLKSGLFNNKISVWLAVCSWCAVIYFFSSIPNLKIEQSGIMDLILRKTAHFCEFALLAVLFLRAFRRTSGNNSARWWIWAGFLSIIYAVTDECHQYFVPGRCPALRDAMIDTLGVISGLIIYKYFPDRVKEW